MHNIPGAHFLAINIIINKYYKKYIYIILMYIIRLIVNQLVEVNLVEIM